MGVKVGENPVDILNQTDIPIPTVGSRVRDTDKEDESRGETITANAKVRRSIIGCLKRMT